MLQCAWPMGILFLHYHRDGVQSSLFGAPAQLPDVSGIWLQTKAPIILLLDPVHYSLLLLYDSPSPISGNGAKGAPLREGGRILLRCFRHLGFRLLATAQ